MIVIGVGLLNGCTTQQPPEGIQNKNPISTCSGNPTTGIIPLSVDFIGTGNDSDGTILAYYWDFGDGSSANQQNPSHIFTSVGIFNVTLTVTDDDGATNNCYVMIQCYTPVNTSMGNWTQNGINYVCQKYGDASECVRSMTPGLQFTFTYQENTTYTGIRGSTAYIVRMIVTGSASSITLTNPNRPTINNPLAELTAMNGNPLSVSDADILQQHDENSLVQWCYQP